MGMNYRYTIFHTSKGWMIKETLNLLHAQQLDMIDEAVEKSNLQQAKDLIDYIKNKG